LKVGTSSFEINATDEKLEKLQDKYGDDILGLSATSLQEVREDLLPFLVNEIKVYLRQ